MVFILLTGGVLPLLSRLKTTNITTKDLTIGRKMKNRNKLRIEEKCLRVLSAKKNVPHEIKYKKLSFHNNEIFIYDLIEHMIDMEYGIYEHKKSGSR